MENRGFALKYIENQTEELCLIAVREDPVALQFVKSQTEDICIEAVRRNGYVLKDVNNQTYRMCLEAVKNNGRALKYIKWDIGFTEEQKKIIHLEAIKQSAEVLDIIEDKEKYMKLINMKILEETDEYMQLIAFKMDGKWLFNIGNQKNITEEEFKKYIESLYRKTEKLAYTKFLEQLEVSNSK
ncbi:hypothetical protein BN174_3470002 [Clostridioides difficile E15]|uniref:DUF4116 domain-containing protein n=1 Tax=Clostridioides difficile TaxID=1496 RepID=UPI0003B28399|nr:DUF4116 domain-containing protein [Clostridioides difficile]MDW0077029.1 hypothetical protein [Clostridioides difficile]CCL32146.1 hypothetical protein BN174_3470002 [Clostridioides difficile E15]